MFSFTQNGESIKSSHVVPDLIPSFKVVLLKEYVSFVVVVE